MPRLSRLLVLLLLPGLLGGLATPGSAQNCTPGVRGALDFDGVNDFVRAPNHAALNNMAAFTFEMLFRAPSAGPAFRALMDHGGGNPWLLAVSLGKPTVFLDGLQAMQSATIVTDNVWHHFALTGAGSVVTLYLDGQAAGTASYVNPLNATSNELVIGASFAGGSYFDHWTGGIDEVRIWNVTRTATQIDTHRLYSLTGAEPGLVAYYRFDSGAQTVVNLATSTGATLNATLGPDANVTAEDPTFTTSDYSPMFYCITGAGQPNSAQARLQVNGVGAGVASGPFQVGAPSGTALSFTWSGPPNSPFALLAGQINTANANFGCAGKADIGTPPFYGDLVIFLNGLTAPGSLLYVLSASGTATQTFTVPQAAVGLSTTLQGMVIQPAGGCPLVLTAAFQLSIT